MSEEKKNRIIWRLKEQPSSESLRDLVKDGILSKEEAREILFSQEVPEDRDEKSLESEIKFLRELVEKLSKSRTEIIEVIKEVKVPYYRDKWYAPYQVWCSTMDNLSSGTGNFSTSGSATYTETPIRSFSSITTF